MQLLWLWQCSCVVLFNRELSPWALIISSVRDIVTLTWYHDLCITEFETSSDNIPFTIKGDSNSILKYGLHMASGIHRREIPYIPDINFCLFVCLECIIPLESFSLIWRRHNCRWRAANFDLYARHSWPLSSEGSLTCHTYYDTGLPFIMVISEDPWHSHLMPSVWQWSCHYLVLRLRSVVTRDWTLISRMQGNALALCHCGSWSNEYQRFYSDIKTGPS